MRIFVANYVVTRSMIKRDFHRTYGGCFDGPASQDLGMSCGSRPRQLCLSLWTANMEVYTFSSIQVGLRSYQGRHLS